MDLYRSRTFRSGNSEAVRLPKELGFGNGVEVMLSRTADGVLIRRRWPSNAEVMAGLSSFPRAETIQERDPFEAPDRPGL